MTSYKKSIAEILAPLIDGLTAEEIEQMIEIPADEKMGDYAFPCFRLAKILRKAPPLIVQTLRQEFQMTGSLKGGKCKRLCQLLSFKRKIVGDIVKEVGEKKENFTKSNKGEGKTVIVEFSSPNIAKPFHNRTYKVHCNRKFHI